ncbi:HAD-IC family P-type ATPase [Microcoleus sp. S36b_A3]|uniref:HAD-IC family P-type ATPase n=1 Tax=unclassified Microcoleus TaxID=2642155 RepID=UPI002FD6318A
MTAPTDRETLSHLSLEDLQKQPTTSNEGLSKKEALQRQSKGGYNELPETTVSPIMQFLSHFWGPIAWMIEAAVILSAIVGDWVNFGIILVLLIGNGVVGFWEEFQAGNAIAGFAKRGFRSLGVARTEDGDNWQFLGVIPLFDPPRSDSQLMIQAVKKLGIDLKMLTGDQQAIARETAHQLGLKGDILDASLLEAAAPHETGQVSDAIEAAAGFAQVFPEPKYHIVDVLQQRGHLVGMAGEGVNDAPALKKADAGIAVSGATDAARAAADIVLLTPGLSVIVEAIQESRRIFQRMNNYAIYRITETIRVLLFMTLSILVYNFYPVTAMMIVLLALLNDGAIISIAYDNTRPANRPET